MQGMAATLHLFLIYHFFIGFHQMKPFNYETGELLQCLCYNSSIVTLNIVQIIIAVTIVIFLTQDKVPCV